jgi:hypothetical protein
MKRRQVARSKSRRSAEAGARYGGLLAKMTAAIAADLATRRDSG